MAATLSAPGAALEEHAVAVFLSEDARHVGVLFVHPEEGDVLSLHLLGHHELFIDEPSADTRWVVPAHSPEELIGVQVLAALVQEQYAEGRLPYGLDARSAAFGLDGRLHHQDGAGLTCSTLVAVLFASSGLPLILLETWADAPAGRRAQDARAQQKLIDSLSARPFAGPDWLARIQAEVGQSPRLLPIEIAAASGSSGTPLSFTATTAAVAVLQAQLPRREA